MVRRKISTIEDLRGSLSVAEPPSGLAVPLLALWWAAKDEWERAHSLVQADGGSLASWVHAYLHRVEGDVSNAAYWYRRAGREPTTSSLDVEWEEIAANLLDGDS